jgi:hypothetical protein
MNYYQYKKRAPRRTGADYIKPFIVILIFAGIVVAGWNLLSDVLIGGEAPLNNAKVFLDIETGSAKAMTATDSEWKNIPTSINLYEGEKVKTLSDGRVTLSFFDKSVVRIDKSSELNLDKLVSDPIANQIVLDFTEGQLWANVDKERLNTTDFAIQTNLLNIKSHAGVLAFEAPGTLFVLSGSAEVEVLDGKDVLKTVRVGVGQQLLVDEKAVTELSEGLNPEILFALDDSFKTSNWYRWNKQKDNLTPGEEPEEAIGMEEDSEEILEESDNTEEEALEEDETTEDTEEVTETEDEVADEEPVDENDTTPPTQPSIEEPGSNGDSVTLDDIEQKITGSVSEDTYLVIINDYRLSQYKPGSGEFSYNAKVDFDNLEVGENEYTVIAEDKAGNQSEPATITLILPQDVYDTAMEAKEEDADTAQTDSQPAEATSTGGVTITAPNNGENLSTSETAFEIKGEVPEGTAKVLVNDYQLQGFAEGDSEFLYRASSTLGTLEIGELNTYTAKAYDEDDVLLGSASMTIDVESGSNGEGAPAITIPTNTGSYETTLDQLVIGGTVGKWITRVRIDGANINEYIPGSEEWKKTVDLQPGENTFNICAEKEGEEQGCSSITIQYNN